MYVFCCFGRPKKKEGGWTATFKILSSYTITIQSSSRILLCVDDSRATRRAVILSSRISKQFSADIVSVTVSKTSFFGKGYRNAHIWAERYLKRKNITFESRLLSGNPVDVFVNEADENHIIIMGKAKGNEIVKFLLGSKPIHTAQRANCPVLMVN